MELVIELPLAVPDGLAFEVDGTLYIACYRPDRIYRPSTSGDRDVLAEDWQGTALAAPTNIAFGGPDLRQVHREPWSLAYRPHADGRSRVPAPLPDPRMSRHDQ